MNKFDEITKFRLINAFIIAIGINLLGPVLLDLKGEYLLTWVISLFMIAETLAIKTNRWFVYTFTLEQMYRLSVITHIVFTLTVCVYFLNPVYMVYGSLVTTIIDVTIFSAYSILLNNYLANEHPNMMSEFQIIRNSIWADGILIGLVIVTTVTYFFDVTYAVYTFILFNMMFSFWLIKNWNFFKDKKY